MTYYILYYNSIDNLHATIRQNTHFKHFFNVLFKKSSGAGSVSSFFRFETKTIHLGKYTRNGTNFVRSSMERNARTTYIMRIWNVT